MAINGAGDAVVGGLGSWAGFRNGFSKNLMKEDLVDAKSVLDNFLAKRYGEDLIISNYGVNLPSKLDKYIPTWLRPKNISDKEISDIQNYVRSQYIKNLDIFDKSNIYYAQDGSLIYRNPTAQSKIMQLNPSDYVKQFGNDSLGLNDGKGNIYIKKPSIVFPWNRTKYANNMKATIAHEIGHSFQPETYDWYGPTVDANLRQPLTIKPYGKYYTANNDAIKTQFKIEWPANKNKKSWYRSPQEFQSEYNGMVQKGFVNSDGTLNSVGKNILANRFGVDTKAIDVMFDLSVKNGELLQGFKVNNYGKVPALSDYIYPFFKSADGENIIGLSTVGGVGGGLSYGMIKGLDYMANNKSVEKAKKKYQQQKIMLPLQQFKLNK